MSDPESGPSTPKKKRSSRNELSKEEKKSRKQHFSKQWLEEDIFKPWLEETEDASKAKCKTCNLFLGTKKSDLINHAKSQRHQKCLKSVQGTQKITQMFKQSNKSEKQLIIADIRFSLLTVAHNFSFKSIDHVTEVAKLNFTDSDIAKNLQLRRTKCTSIVNNVLSVAIKEELSRELKENNFSILVDESTDISNIRLLCIVVRYISNNQLKTQLLDLIPIKADEGTAKGLYGLFKNCCKSFSINIGNVVGYCSDNASVMMGNKESFKMYLLNENPNIAVNGCTCHSAHLIAAGATQELPSNIEALLQNISNYFSRSPKRQSVLQEFQQYMKTSQLKILSPSKTRWLALSNCIERLLMQWDVLLEVFRLAAFEDKNPVATLILDEMQNPYVKAYLTFLKHVLPIFNSFNAMFQSSKILIDQLYTESRRFVRQLCINFVQPSFFNTDEKLDRLDVTNPHVLLPLEEVNFGRETADLIKDCDKNNNQTFKLRCLKFYQNSVTQAFRRLPVVDSFYKNVSFIIPQNAFNPEVKFDIRQIATKFNNKVDVDKAEAEYISLKVYFSEDEKKEFLKCQDLIEFWSKLKVLKNYNEEYLFKNIGELALIILVLTHGNADVERLFSMMTDVKSQKRNRLLTDALSNALRIKMDLATKGNCCINYPITDNHFKLFNQFMYSFKNKNKAKQQTSTTLNIDTDSDSSE